METGTVDLRVNVASERGTGNPSVRIGIARQLRNKYNLRLEGDPLASVVEANAKYPGILVASFYHDNIGRRLAKAIEGDGKDFIIRRLCSREVVKAVSDESFGFDPVDPKIQIGARSLFKKWQHFVHTRKNQGSAIQSAFADLPSKGLTPHDMIKNQAIAAGYIADIMHDPGTIILRGRTADIINSLGQGVRVNIHGLMGESFATGGSSGKLFTGFVDAMLYADPGRIPQK